MEPSVAIPLILGLPTLASLIFFIGLNIGGYNGIKQGANQATITCIEKPQECKERYEYLKLAEKLGENK